MAATYRGGTAQSVQPDSAIRHIAKGISGAAHFNREELRVLEMPAVNGTGTARSIAKLYGSAATGGSEIGFSPSIFDALKKAAIPPTNGVRDKVMFADTSFSLGFANPASLTIFGASDDAFGTPGRAARSDSPTQTPASATGT